MSDNAPEQQFAIQRIYLRDTSLEMPLGAAVFSGKWTPSIQLDVNTRAEKLSDNQHEVILSLTVTAKQEDTVAMLIEVQQAGIFLCQGLSDEQLRQVLATACPDILFPYARETIDSLAVKASLPPLMLSPMNFSELYRQALIQQQQKPEQAAH